MKNRILALLERTLSQKLGRNKSNELLRLVYEIHRREGLSPEEVLGSEEIRSVASNSSLGHRDRFSKVKKYLLGRRFPSEYGNPGFNPHFPELKHAVPGKSAAAETGGRFIPENIYIEKRAAGTPLARRITSLFPGIKPVNIRILREYRKENGRGPSKRDVFINVRRNGFFKPCPCSTNVLPCGYHIFNLGFGCPYDCSYCYLQQYSNSPGIVLNANPEDFLGVFDGYIAETGNRMIRLGTGEFTDSLALDHITEYSKLLVPFFASKNVFFELKTKSANIDNLKGLEHGGRTVVSWSLNPRDIIRDEEKGTASLEERLAAAKECADEGYKISFHFDPVIHHSGWERNYKEVVDMLFDTIRSPLWISIGTLRFNRNLKNIIEERFPGSSYIYGELLPGRDRKLRYPPALRSEISRCITRFIRDRNKNTPVYLCMEHTSAWKHALGSGRVKDIFRVCSN